MASLSEAEKIEDLQKRLAASEVAFEQEKALREEAEAALEQEKASREEAEAVLEQEKASRVLEKASRERLEETLARTSLFEPSKFTFLVEWLSVYVASNIPPIPDEDVYLSGYTKPPSSLNTSRNYIDSESSKSCVEVVGTIQMNLFRRKMTDRLASKMQVRWLNLSNNAIMALVCKHFHGGDTAQTIALVANLSTSLAKIRAALYFRRKEQDTSCSELDIVQPLVVLLMEHIMAQVDVLRSGHVTLGQGFPLRGTVLVESPPATPAASGAACATAAVAASACTPRTLSGQADLLLFNSYADSVADDNVDGSSLDNLKCVIELKSPFKKLSHGGAHASKDQLLAELEGCGQMMCQQGQMMCQQKHVFGLLSDLFVAGVAIRAPSKAVDGYPIFYQAPRVTDTTSVVLRLLFVLLELSADEFAELLRDCSEEVPVPVDDDAPGVSETGSTEGMGAGGAAGAAGAGAARAICEKRGAAPAARPAEEQGRGRGVSNKFSCPFYLAALRKERVQSAIEQDYKRRGLAYLSADELNRRNQAAVPLKRIVASLL